MQISMRMNMDDEAAVYISFNDGATTIGMHDPIVERLLDDSHHHAGTYSFPSSSSSSLSLPASTSLSCSPESSSAHAPESPAKTTGAFKHYARHLGPKRPQKPGACGQRMFKTAMSVLSKMHVAERYSQQQYYYQAAAAAAAEAVQPPSVNQLQHMLSERKRREKLNDSFHALKAVLPPGSKKDKTSILIRAREYLKTLEDKLKTYK
ncbi:putative transcription factor bHLH041 [Miscanthus floridulus]|uniref:putative transcription factor bHLH041 n=1 Tax=Miscanthus floridulus TaxID=154761 RepID=UPI00345A47D2